MKLAEIAQHIGGTVRGDGQIQIQGLATLLSAKSGDLSFLANKQYRQLLESTEASAVIVTQEFLSICPTHAIVMDAPYLGYAKAARLLMPCPIWQQGIHPTAWVSPAAHVSPTAWVGPNSVIAQGVWLDEQVQIGPHCVIERGCRLGRQTVLVASVVLCDETQIGQRVLIHPGAVVGADGFGLSKEQNSWKKIPQLGRACIGDDVEIGANTTIDRGALDDTEIARGVKIDNLVQVAHNVLIGEHTAIAGCVGIAGSAKIGKRCSIGGGVGILGHVEIVDDVVVTGMTFVSKSIKKAGMYSSGTPLENNRDWRRNMVRMKRLDELAKRVVRLERQMLEKKG